jgi:hypothetical protein
MKKVRLEIIGLSPSVSQSQNYAILLAEHNGNRRLPIIIGGFEANAIAVAWERLKATRPLTHDLFQNVFEVFHINLREVVISNLIDGIFHARLICEQGGITAEIDSRTSDALALAVRCKCPIYTYEFILEAAGVIIDNQSGQAVVVSQTAKSKDGLSGLSLDELQRNLENAIEKEEYERAAKIRDEINKRNQKL